MGKEKRAWRKEVKKIRRKGIRQKLAVEMNKVTEELEEEIEAEEFKNLEEDSGEINNNPTDMEGSEGQLEIDKDYFLSREEWEERERLTELECAMKRALEEKLAISRAEEERKIREEWEDRERKEKLEKEEKERLEKARKEKQDEEFDQFLEFLCGDIETPPLPYIMPEDFDTGEEVCLNFSKTGVCRYYDRCKLAHQNPRLSQTILIPNFFTHFLLEESLRGENDTDLGLEYEHSELYKEFLEFHSDVLPEFQKHGKVIQFKVCCNFEPHLRGNVYIQFENIRSAVEAFRTFNARFYNGKQISLRFAKIDSWKTAICWSFLRRNCIRGRSCNYLHVFRNPTKEFVLADRDWKELPTKASGDQNLKKTWNETSPMSTLVTTVDVCNSKTQSSSDNVRNKKRSADRRSASVGHSKKRLSRSRSNESRSERHKKTKDHRSSRSRNTYKTKKRSKSPKLRKKHKADVDVNYQSVSVGCSNTDQSKPLQSQNTEIDSEKCVLVANSENFAEDEPESRKQKKHKKHKKSKKSKKKKKH